MRKMKSCGAVFLALAMLAGACLAQNADKSEPQKFYRLDFLVKELEAGKTINSRSYFMTVATGPKQESQIRTGSRVPFQSSPGNWQQLNVGTSFDCIRIQETPLGLSIFVSASVESLLEQPSSAGESQHPIIRENSWHSTVVLPLKKPTVIFSSDDPASKRQMQVELTATPIS
ncbi:MAG TPA: hypothetical protein VHZ07_18515 [Bryobacteraceae bacterium]|jgi:hypothetical protein|nr:hypothetical protein [Bryobacteraceae bacterium]